MAFFEEAIISGFIGEAIGRCTDVSWKKIKEAVKNRKHEHQNIESQIYNVIVNVLNQITFNRYENDQDKIYQAAEKLLMGYKDDRCDSIEVVRSGLHILGESVNSDKYMEFKMQLYQEISKSDYEELYHQIRLLQQDEESSKTLRIEEKVDKVQQSVDEANRRLDAFQENNRRKDNVQNKEPVRSRTQEYADKWNDYMFLNDYDKRDQEAGINVKLREVYLEEHLPHYIWYKNNENAPSTDLKELLSEYVNEKRDNKMLLILGQPGIGKSTLITWIAANFSNMINDILVYKFASDLKNIDWHNEGISNRMLGKLGLNYNDLNGKILILDGFDEVSIEANRRRDILDCLYIDWINTKSIKNFSLIITCRENYVSKFTLLLCRYITLQPWNERQIKSFCNIFQEKTKYDISKNTIEKLLENKRILGIPLILYMVLALNISIDKEGSIVDVYDKIFSLEGGIYDRCIDNKMFADKHRIGEIKQQIHQVSRDIAIWMFENNSAEAFIPQREYQKICVNIMQKQEQNNANIEHDFLIGNYFKLVKHCEGIETEQLYFVHRSIYEYFVAETIFSSINESVDQSKESLAGVFGKLLKRGNLSPIIFEYLKHKIIKSKLRDAFESVNDTFQLMLQDGMTYYTNKTYRNVLDCEMKVFENMLEIMHLWERDCYRFEDKIIYYIKIYMIMNTNEILNCNETDFSNVDFSEMDLTCVYLKNAILNEANLNGVNLSLTDLSGISLVGASLIGICLTRSHLTNANLRMANLTNADLRMASLTGADLTDIDLTGAEVSNPHFKWGFNINPSGV